VRQKLGEGGMGSVYLAEHPHIGKKVALKVLHAEFASNTDVVTRFFNEAKAVNDIGHPNIVDIVDYGVLQLTPAARAWSTSSWSSCRGSPCRSCSSARRRWRRSARSASRCRSPTRCRRRTSPTSSTAISSPTTSS
jgi:hypothetical protein